jgi:3-phenylpropionate/trans-cinnamate dioxygenase ferredoxin subunit
MTSAQPLPFPPELQAPGTAGAPFEPLARLDQIPKSGLLRVTVGDLDVLIAATEAGLVATEDRCPHMSAPLSEGTLDGCALTCPLHRGRFDLSDGETLTFPTTGGLTADGEYRATWAPPGSRPKPPPSDSKARARALTRVRRMRYFPLRISDGVIEVRLPR